MSNVTQSGLQGYEYQYLVSLLIGLQQLENDTRFDKIEIRVIKEGYITQIINLSDLFRNTVELRRINVPT